MWKCCFRRNDLIVLWLNLPANTVAVSESGLGILGMVKNSFNAQDVTLDVSLHVLYTCTWVI